MYSKYVENCHCTFSRLAVYHRRWGESGLKAMTLIIHFLPTYSAEDKDSCVHALKGSVWACFLISTGHKHMCYSRLSKLCAISPGSQEHCFFHCWITVAQTLNLEFKISLHVSKHKSVFFVSSGDGKKRKWQWRLCTWKMSNIHAVNFHLASFQKKLVLHPWFEF